MQANNKKGLGIIGEKFVNAVAKSIFKARKGFKVKHIDWNNYSYGFGARFKGF